MVVLLHNQPIAILSSINPEDIEKEYILLPGKDHYFIVKAIDAIPNINV
jgi:hypothetical protein